MSAGALVRGGAIGAALGAAVGLLVAIAGVAGLAVLNLGPHGQYVGSLILVLGVGMIIGLPSGTAIGLASGALAGLLDAAVASRLPRRGRWIPAGTGAGASVLLGVPLSTWFIGEPAWTLSVSFAGVLVLVASAFAACRHGIGRWPLHRLLRSTNSG